MIFAMCQPKYYGIYYEINSWMSLNNPSIPTLVQQQWQALYQGILETGASVKLIDPIPGLPDMVFTANAAIIHKNQTLIATFSAKERQGESKYFKDWFYQAGFDVVNASNDFTKEPFFEGAGDALFLGDTLIAGYGFRSQLEVYQRPFFKQFKVVPCQLVMPLFYHIDTCFCPLSADLAIWYPKAFSAQAQQLLLNNCKLIDVEENEAKRFACNAIVINEHILLPTGCPNLTRQLESLGFKAHAFEMSEFLKAGGACKCLTLKL